MLKLPAALAPVKMAALPLLKKNGLPDKACEIVNTLKFDYNLQYDEKDSISERYLDTMKQERVNIDNLESILEENVSMKNLFKELVKIYR